MKLLNETYPDFDFKVEIDEKFCFKKKNKNESMLSVIGKHITEKSEEISFNIILGRFEFTKEQKQSNIIKIADFHVKECRDKLEEHEK